MYLITDGPKITQENKIDALGIKDIFDFIIINDSDKGVSKKDERPFLQMLSKLGVEAKNSYYIGDNPTKDFVVAKRLGVNTIRINRGSGLYDGEKTNEEFEADHTISTLLDIQKFIFSSKGEAKWKINIMF